MIVIGLTQSIAAIIPVLMRGVGSGDGIAGYNVSTAFTVSLRKSGGAYTTITPTITDRGGGVYDIALTASHLDTTGVAALRVHATANANLAIEDVLVNDDILINVIAPEFTTGTVVADGSNTATTFKTDLTSTNNNHWNDVFIEITSGTLSGQAKKITAYDGTTKFVTTAGFTGTPAAGVTFNIINK